MTKRLIAMLAALSMSPAMAAPFVNQQRGYSEQCFKEVYREEYVPGTRKIPGRVRRWTENVQVSCRNEHTPTPLPRIQDPVDDNSCVEGSIIGGILGGAAGGAASRRSTENDMVWAIPLGVVGGAMLGCQLDGG